MPNKGMFSFFRNFLFQKYQPLNQILIDKSQLQRNFQLLSQYQEGVKLAPVLKSNAYGHGLTKIASVLDKERPPFFCIDSIYEAFLLQKNNTKSDIVIMGAIDQSRLSHKKLSFQLTILSLEHIELFQKYQPKAKVHLFIDTGMNREGVRIEDLEKVIEKLKKSNLDLVGVMTHLAIASEKDHPLTVLQIKNFTKAKKLILKSGFDPKWWHIGGSDALLWINPKIANVVRVGRILYGIETTSPVDPILQLASTIIQIKQVKKGERVGYESTFRAKKDLTIAILPIGYNDGVHRNLSNKGSVQIRGVICPIIGLISMNIMVVDISRCKKVMVGDKAIIFAPNPKNRNSIQQSAKLARISCYELLVGLHPSTRRDLG